MDIVLSQKFNRFRNFILALSTLREVEDKKLVDMVTHTLAKLKEKKTLVQTLAGTLVELEPKTLC